jgi:two-component system cell cycle response regulator
LIIISWGDQSINGLGLAEVCVSANKDSFSILVADDSAVYRKLIQQTFSQADFSIEFASSGQQAIDFFQAHTPALVITDWMMPDITGIDLCQKIRASSKDSYTYIILLTSVSEKENVVKGLAAGADDYLTKPFHPDELIARVGVGRRIADLHRQIEAKNHLLEELALTDSLTGLPNRRAIEEWAGRQLSGAARHGFYFWVVMADLDHFKKINDSFGHEAGDTVLKKFAEILRTNSRHSDICGRTGGEEFLFVLTYTEKENVEMVVERTRKQLEDHVFSFGGHETRVTASFGISCFHGKIAPNFGDLVKQADVALYEAKRQGRNRTEFAKT